MLSLLLSASLWVASQEARTPPVQYVIVPIEKVADRLVGDIVWNGAGFSSDLLSTSWALQHGCVEANPNGQTVEARIALKVGLSSARLLVSYWLRRTGHRTYADVWRWVGVGADAFITGNNIYCGVSK